MERAYRAFALGALAFASCTDPAYRSPADAAEPREDAAAIVAGDGAARADSTAGSSAVKDAGEDLITEADTAIPTETVADGGQVSLVPAMPDWARPLLGRYAARSYFFAQDGYGTVLRVRDYLLLDIVETSDADPHVELRVHVCDSYGEGPTGDTQVVAPDALHTRVHRVLFGDHSWATQAPDTADGFERALPARCRGRESTLVDKDPGQTWIAGPSCRCPASVDVAPSAPEDCRLIDQDEDGFPGGTVAFTSKVLGLGNVKLFVATINRTTFVNGSVGSDGRHSAQVAVDQFGWQLGCDPPGCADISATPAPCPPTRNKLELVAQDTSYTCTQVLADAITLFPNSLPASPTSCP